MENLTISVEFLSFFFWRFPELPVLPWKLRVLVWKIPWKLNVLPRSFQYAISFNCSHGRFRGSSSKLYKRAWLRLKLLWKPPLCTSAHRHLMSLPWLPNCFPCEIPRPSQTFPSKRSWQHTNGSSCVILPDFRRSLPIRVGLYGRFPTTLRWNLPVRPCKLPQTFPPLCLMDAASGEGSQLF